MVACSKHSGSHVLEARFPTSGQHDMYSQARRVLLGLGVDSCSLESWSAAGFGKLSKLALSSHTPLHGLSFGWVFGKAQAALYLIFHVLCIHRDCETLLVYPLALLAHRLKELCEPDPWLTVFTAGPWALVKFPACIRGRLGLALGSAWRRHCDTDVSGQSAVATANHPETAGIGMK